MGEGLEFFYWCLAIAGTLLFIAKTALLFVGGGDDGGGDAGFDGGDTGLDAGVHSVDSVGHDHHGGDSTAAFNLLSLQSLATLAMGGGWMGLLAIGQLELRPVPSAFLALAFGLALVYLMGKLMLGARRLESSGTLDPRTAVGHGATVYLTIPEGGRGQVQVVVQGRLATLDARTSATTLPTGARVRVESVDPNGLLVVAPA